MMKNPFKRINPAVDPPEELGNAVFQRLSIARLMLSIAKLFTRDMVKTGVDSIDGIQKEDESRPPGPDEMRDVAL